LENTSWSMYHRTNKFLRNLNLIETELLRHEPSSRHLIFMNTAVRDSLFLMSMLRPSLARSTRISYHVAENGLVMEELSRMMELDLTVPYAGRYDSERTNEANQSFYVDRNMTLREIVVNASDYLL